eukprot:m.159478 g.159478  ORF g.159478 m.159478 type:complete len:65 (-) comp14531_c1_seq1:1314-1508(-)
MVQVREGINFTGSTLSEGELTAKADSNVNECDRSTCPENATLAATDGLEEMHEPKSFVSVASNE